MILFRRFHRERGATIIGARIRAMEMRERNVVLGLQMDFTGISGVEEGVGLGSDDTVTGGTYPLERILASFNMVETVEDIWLRHHQKGNFNIRDFWTGGPGHEDGREGYGDDKRHGMGVPPVGDPRRHPGVSVLAFDDLSSLEQLIAGAKVNSAFGRVDPVTKVRPPVTNVTTVTVRY